MGDEYMKQGYDHRDRRPFPAGDYCEPPRPEPPVQEACCEPEPCRDDDWDWGSWLPILILIFFLCGGTNLLGGFGFGGGSGGGFGFGGRDDCDDGGGGGFSWIVILILVVLLIGGSNDRDGGGFLGGLGGLGGWF